MSFEDNIFNSPAETGGPLWAGEVDYGGAAAYPTSVLDTGGGGGGLSASWERLFQGSIGKGLDYFIAKDAFETRAEAMPQSYPSSYYRGADGRVYRSNGMPVSNVGQPAGGNSLLMLALVVGAVVLLAKA